VVLSVEGEYVPEYLKIYLTSSSSHRDPILKIINANTFKVFFDETYPTSASYTFVIQEVNNGFVDDVTSEVKTLWGKASDTTKKLFKYIFYTALITILVGGVLTIDKKYNNSKFTKLYRKMSAFWVADKLSEKINFSVLTNDSPVYISDKFMDVQNEIREKDGVPHDFRLKTYFWNVGDGILAMRKLVRTNGEVQKVDYSTAEDFCDSLNGYIPSKSELNFLTNRSIKKARGFEFAVSDENSIAEWTRTEIESDDDYNYVHLKNDGDAYIDSKYFTDGLGGDTDKAKFAFRCVIYEKDFL
jgi:hypothetical protein